MSKRSSERATVWAVIAFAGYTEFRPNWTRADARAHAKRVFGKVWRIRVERVRA